MWGNCTGSQDDELTWRANKYDNIVLINIK